MLPPLTVKSYAAAHTMRPSTLPKPRDDARRPAACRCRRARRRAPSACRACRSRRTRRRRRTRASRSRAVSLPRACCFSILLGAAHLADLARAAPRGPLTSSRIVSACERRLAYDRRHFPVHFGARFSRNAISPSRASSVAEALARGDRGAAGAPRSRSRSSCAANARRPRRIVDRALRGERRRRAPSTARVELRRRRHAR